MSRTNNDRPQLPPNAKSVVIIERDLGTMSTLPQKVKAWCYLTRDKYRFLSAVYNVAPALKPNPENLLIIDNPKFDPSKMEHPETNPKYIMNPKFDSEKEVNVPHTTPSIHDEKVKMNVRESWRSVTVYYCDGTEVPAPGGGSDVIFNLTPVSFPNISRDGSTRDLTLTTNQGWAVTDSPPWVVLDPATGTGSDDPQPITITIGSNAGNPPRNTSVTITAGGQAGVITLEQNGV